MKKASSRSQRGSKGIKGKHVLQICVLLGVCIWLIYQVKYSHDKNKEFYDKDNKKSTVVSEDGLVKLGRKDLLPVYHKDVKPVEEDEDGEEEKERKSKVENVNHVEEEEEEVVEEDEEDKSKLGEEVVEEDEDENKHEEDEIDEQDQSKDTDKEDELLEEGKEGGEKESNNHGDEVDEAREEHYKADDASSAVSHESRVLKTENAKENSTETGQVNDPNAATTTEVKIQTQPVLKYGEAENGELINKTASEVKDGESGLSTSEVNGQENNPNADTSEVKTQKEPVLKLGDAESGGSVGKTTTEVKDGDGESAVTELRGETVNGSSTEAILEASRFLRNETEIMRERSHEHENTKDGAPPPLGSSDLKTVLELEQASNESDHNMTVVSADITSKDESGNSTTSESSLTENTSGQNTTAGVQENSRSEGDDETEEKESSDLFSTEQIEEADDTSETTMLQEEREALTDTQTLPDIRAEGNEDEEDGITAE